MGASWLRGRGKDLAAKGKPWFLALNLVNPHDIMFPDTDRPGQASQAKNLIGRIHSEPDDMRSHDGLVGHIAEDDEWRWRWRRRRHNGHLNCQRDVDRNLSTLLDALDALGLATHHRGAHRRPRRSRRHAPAARQGRHRLPRAEPGAADRRAPGPPGRRAL
jgi:arylsulfatase